MASMRDIKRRKGTIASTQQITKAMKLVSTVKLQKAKTKAEESKPYFDTMYQTVQSILSMSDNIKHPYLESVPNSRKAVIVITSNRGLAGGYNSSISKLVVQGDFPQENVDIYTVGKKGKDALERAGYTVKADFSLAMEEPTYHDAKVIAREILKAYEQGAVGEIYLAYTVFKNTVVHYPVMNKLLPVCAGDAEPDTGTADGPAVPMNFEMDEAAALDLLIPKYITSMIYGALLESLASENGARMQAMDAATSNADEMIGKLSLQYNRARQGSITQELTEIIAGAQAIS